MMVRVALRLLAAMRNWPLPLVRALGVALGWLFYTLGAARRRITLINLRLCFPDKTEAERKRIARAHFRVFAQSIMDRSLLWWASAERIQQHVHWIDYHHFEAALARGPVILLAPHFVGLDAGGILLGMDRRAGSMYAPQKNPDFDAAVLAGRNRFNKPVLLTRQDGVRRTLKMLKEGLPFYYLPDMDLGRRDAVFVPFFGIQTATITGLARLAKLSSALVVPCVTRMTPDGYDVHLYPAWENYPGDDIEAATAQMNAFIEQRVLEMPEQYLWTHKRFKTRPEGEASYY